ncbi:MAG: AI-2E family transporter, partial [Thermodesulfobacteriota bacterium]
LVITAYLTMDFHKFIDSLRRLVPRPVLPAIEKIALDVNRVLRDFLVGQLLVAMALGAMYSVGLALARTPLALVIGPLAGLLALVPYLGFAFGFGVATLLTLLEHNDLAHLLGVALTFGVAHTVDGWFLTPRLLGKRVGLHPVWILAAFLLGGNCSACRGSSSPCLWLHPFELYCSMV